MGTIANLTKPFNDIANYGFNMAFDSCECHVEQVSDFLLVRKVNGYLEHDVYRHAEKSSGITSMSIFLDGHGSLELGLQKRLAILPSMLVMTQGASCSFNLLAGTRVHLLEILFDSHALFRQGFDLSKIDQGFFFYGTVKDGLASIVTELPSHSESIVKQIMQTETAALLGKLKLQAKALELLSESICCKYSDLNSEHEHYGEDIEKKKINKATKIIEEKYYEPLTIRALSREVGLNEKKLKDGFREFLGTTVHTYIENVRLNVARELLGKGKRITDTAIEVGYSSPSHFAKRFHKNFGQTPKSWQMMI